MSKKLNEKELIKYLNSYGIAKRLKFLAGTLLENKRKFRFEFKYDEGSYTDGATIHVGIPKYLVGHTREEVFGSLKALTAHEVEHCNSTPFNEYREFITNFAKYFKDNYSINEAVSSRMGQYISNSVEDGRIERILCKRAPGLYRPLIYFRGLWWENNICTGEDELNDCLFLFCTFATMGQYPLGFIDHYEENEELIEMFRGIKPQIFKAVDTDDFAESCNHIWEAIYKIEDWLVEKLKEAEDNMDDYSEKMDELVKKFGKLSEENSSTESSSAKISKGPIPVPGDDGELMESEDDKEDEKEGEGSKENKNSDSKSDKESNALRDAFSKQKGLGSKNLKDSGIYDSEERMEDIIKRAMKNAEIEVNKSERESVAQASFDDLKKAKQDAKEKAEKIGSSLTDSDKSSIRKFYADIERSWDVPLKIKTHNYTLLDTPVEIKLSAKKIKKEFTEIFLNKSTLNSRNRKRGMLDTSGLWKYGVDDFNLFKKKGKPEETDYAFYLLIDGSGSMGMDGKFEEAYRATSLLEEAISEFAPLRIVQFNCLGRKVNHNIIKDYEQVKKGKNYSWTFVNNHKADGCNMDGYSIRVATAEINKRPERKKVLIILSDGLPSGEGGYYGEEAETDVKKAIREARKNKIDVFNIMFGDERERAENLPNFKYMYEKCIISCETEKIATTLLRIVKKELFK